MVPPLTHDQAAALARAALCDTLAAVADCAADRKVLVLDGPLGDWLPEGFEVRPQRGDGLAERLAAAWHDVGGPALQIGMDTPQVTAELLDQGLALLGEPGVDAVLGPASDGGWWAIGMNRPDPQVFSGIPMSTPDTGSLQAQRLRDRGLRTRLLQSLSDVDTVSDAQAVARLIPGSEFAKTLANLGLGDGIRAGSMPARSPGGSA
jgi:glycosyltransferase A (GT-A) superfamily protein (DUF2064 family)